MSYKPRETGPFAGLKLIDADSHITEPTDLWTKRAPARYKDRVPQTGVDNSDGKSYWWVDADKKFGPDSSIAFVRKNGKKIPYYGADRMGGPRDDIHAAASEAKPRVELLDQMGIYTQIVYPNVMGFAAPALVQNLDRELFSTIVAIYNDAMAEWQEERGGRVLPPAGRRGGVAAPGRPARPRHAALGPALRGAVRPRAADRHPHRGQQLRRP